MNPLPVAPAEAEVPLPERRYGLIGDAEQESSEAQAMPLHWAVADIVRSRFPYTIVEPTAKGKGASHAPGDVKWIFGTHHMAGTDLIRSLAREQAEMMNVEGCFSMGKYGWRPPDCGKKKSPKFWFVEDMQSPHINELANDYDIDWHGAHLVRDPLAMLVSGYIYHMKHHWSAAPELTAEFNSSLEEGLKLELRRLHRTVGMMVVTYRNLPPSVINLRLEKFLESSHSFDENIAKLYNHSCAHGLSPEFVDDLKDRATKWDLRRHPETYPDHNIVHDPKVKQKVHAILDAIPAKELYDIGRMRKALGYMEPQYMDAKKSFLKR